MNGSHKYFLLVSDVDGKDYTRNWRIKGFVVRTQIDSLFSFLQCSFLDMLTVIDHRLYEERLMSQFYYYYSHICMFLNFRGRKRRREKEGEMDRLISFNYEPSRPLLSNLGPINGIMTLSIMLKLFGERNSCLLIKSLI